MKAGVSPVEHVDGGWGRVKVMIRRVVLGGAGRFLIWVWVPRVISINCLDGVKKLLSIEKN